MDGGAWWAAVHGVARSRTRLSDFTFTFHFHALEKEMATHSSVRAWRIPGKGEPGGLPSMGSHKVGHDWSDLAAAAAAVFEAKNTLVLGMLIFFRSSKKCKALGFHIKINRSYRVGKKNMFTWFFKLRQKTSRKCSAFLTCSAPKSLCDLLFFC